MNNIKFHDDLNLYQVYQDVLSLINDYKAQKDSISIEYKRLAIIAKMSHNPADRTRATILLKEKGGILSIIEDDALITKYMKRVSPLITEYQNLCGISKVFGMDTCTNIPKRVSIIVSFLEISKEYVPLSWTSTYRLDKICPKCYTVMNKKGNIIVCSKCSYSYVVIRAIGSNMDGTYMRLESTYIASKNFRKEYMHVCGIISNIKDMEQSDIESYIYRANIQHPVRENIRDGIRICGYKNYRDTNKLYSLITNEPLPPIIGYIDICVLRFEQYWNVFQPLEYKIGENITNIHFLIRLFLWQEKVEYRNDWFRSLTVQTENKHKKNAKRICIILQGIDCERNWAYPPEWDKDI